MLQALVLLFVLLAGLLLVFAIVVVYLVMRDRRNSKIQKQYPKANY